MNYASFVFFLPVIALITAFMYGGIIYRAITKMNFVKATIWRGKSGFSIEAHSKKDDESLGH
jgi:hypothetical protein